MNTTSNLPSAEELLKGRIGPDGTTFRDIASGDAELDANETWLRTTKMLKLVGGEPFNPGSLDKLLEEHGAARVWFHAVWFRPRLASRTSPPDKPAPLLAKCIEGDFAVKPCWATLTFSRIKHGCFTKEQSAQVPTSDSPAEWYRWLHTFGGALEDLSRDIRMRIKAAVAQGDPATMAAMEEEFDDSEAPVQPDETDEVAGDADAVPAEEDDGDRATNDELDDEIPF